MVNSYNIELSKEREYNNQNNKNEVENRIHKSAKLDLSDIQDDENLVNFMENLDYDKYLKNQETREALFLLKNKIEKQKENEPEEKQEENLNEDNQNNSQRENYSQKYEEEVEINLPLIDAKAILQHERDWNAKFPNEDPEILKKKVADRILKLDKVKINNNSLFIEFKNCSFCSIY